MVKGPENGCEYQGLLFTTIRFIKVTRYHYIAFASLHPRNRP